MKPDISLEWDSGPAAEHRSAAEIYASVGLAVPSATHAGVDDADDRIGTVSARHEGRLLGWVSLYRQSDAGLRAQGERAGRLARRLVRGAYDGDAPTTAEEREAVRMMYRRAAEQARAAGAHVLRWTGTDTGPEGEAAHELAAKATGEIARIWTIDPADWLLPGGLPAVRVRSLPTPHVGVIGEGAEIIATLASGEAYINAAEAIVAPGVEADMLAAVLAELVRLLRREYPDVYELAVFEFDGDIGGTVRQALPLAGLRIEHRLLDYELRLA
ncbi:hypothetical protein [Embleya sp. NBC_00896]|uniref:hypothetical protein n=1 Tax=Embleya sp. NBC_00896 TaxID=2975961 RepID=UPI0038641DCC|nr:hypothetical protein OG928_02970 [Embleya sp. NBC_00896]